MDKKKNLPPQKFYFDIKVETMVPATITYRILAEDPEQALTLMKPSLNPYNVAYKLPFHKPIKIMVYNAGSNLLRFIKNIVGR